MTRQTSMQPIVWLRRRIRAEWQGPPGLSRSLMLEWRLMAARWVAMLFIAPALPLLGLSPSRLTAAYLILTAAVAYNLAVRHCLPRRPQILASGYLTTFADSLLNVAMVAVGGGFNGPFSYFLFTVIISIAMRYGYRPAMVATCMFVAFDVLEKLSWGVPLNATVAFRAGFLCITGLLAGYLRRVTQHTELMLQERLLELQRLYSDLAIAHQELLTLDEAKTSFLANVSHELRTPLTSIRAFSEMLLSYEDDEEVKREFVQIISTESERLTRLVNDVLDVTKIESGQMDWREDRLDVSAILDLCVRTYAPLLEQSNLSFNHDIAPHLPPIVGDRDRLQQVVQNLLNNALKFTSRGSITLRAGLRGDEVAIDIVDTGVGIAPEDQQRVFEKFQQVGDTLTGKPQGTGLGLTICRDIIAHHGGRLTLSSQRGRGSTFTIWLPIARPQQRAA